MITRAIKNAVTLSVGTTPPREFRLFKAGINRTSKGDFLFDAAAAASVMKRWREAGSVDVLIDLEHLSFTPEARTDATDARGWAKLEVRNGELWAVDVRWTPDGVERLTSRKQRYISPAFARDKEGRITELISIGLVSQPATYAAPALVAASKYGRKTSETLATRLARQTARSLRIVAAEEGLTVSALLRRFAVKCAASATLRKLAAVFECEANAAAIETAAKALFDRIESAPALDPDDVQQLEALATALELDPATATSNAIQDALAEALKPEEPEGDPLADSPQPAPPAQPELGLSRVERDGLAKLTTAERTALARITDERKRSKFLELASRRPTKKGPTK